MAIRKVVERERWNFVNGELNPADIPARISSNLLECFAGCWVTGPPGLCALPVCGNEISLGGKVDEEVVVACSSEVVLNNATRKDTTDETCSLSDILDCTRYSSLKKLTISARV